MPREKKHNTKYSPEFKISVIMDMRENCLSYREVMRKYFPHFPEGNYKFLRQWERIYLEEGAAGLMRERRGRTTKADNPNRGRPRKKALPTEVENDLIAENQRLKEALEYALMENEYLKKLDALVRAEEQRNGKKPR